MKRGLTFPELAVGLTFVAIAAVACLSPAQADTFWALRAGEDIWRNGRVPLVDTYSHTAAGRAWPDHEWLWQAIAYGLYRLGGLPFVTLSVAALITSAYLFVYRQMVGPPLTRIAVLLAGLPLATNAWALRPQVASLCLLAALVSTLMRGRLWLIPPLFALWANLHGGVVLGGLVMVGATAAAALWSRERLPGLVLATVLGGAATLLTPLGVGLWTFIARWVLAARQTGVSEWAPVAPTSREGVVFWISALLFVALAARGWRRATAWPDRLSLVTALVLLPCAIRSVRNVSPFLLVAVPAASRLIGRRTPRAASTGTSVDHPRGNVVALAVAAIGAAVAIAVLWRSPSPTLGWRPMSPAAAAAIGACPAPIYNGYNDGGYLIWFVRHQLVFVDGRHDPYPPELLIADRQIETGADPRPLFARTGVRCAALSAGTILASTLRRQGWRSRFADAQWLVLEPPRPAE